MRWNLLVRNPADAASPPAARATRPKPPKIWSTSELRSFLDHVRNDRLFAAYVLLATTGARRGEVLGLKWRNLDLDAANLSIIETVVSVNYEMQNSTPKTSAGRRLVPLDGGTVAEMRAHRQRQDFERAFMGAAYEDDDLVFAREDGRPIHPHGLSDAFRRHVRDAGLPPLSLHGLRHSHASHLLAANTHTKVVQERLGHSSISITLDRYSHSIPVLQETALGLVAAQIFR